MAENEQQKFLELIRKKAALKLLFLPHAVRQMNRPDRMISPAEVKKTVLEGVIVEEYPEDVRGHSCLMLEFCEGGRPVHVVCAPKEDYLAIITAYIPDKERWADDYRTRKTP